MIEIVSNQVGDELGEKLCVYEHMRVSYYIVYDPTQQLGEQILQIYELRGRRYAETQGIWLEQVGLGLTDWQGEFQRRQDTWLRWCNQDGDVLLTGDERAEQIQKGAITQLLSMGLSQEQVANTLGLAVQEIEQLASQP